MSILCGSLFLVHGNSTCYFRLWSISSRIATQSRSTIQQNFVVAEIHAGSSGLRVGIMCLFHLRSLSNPPFSNVWKSHREQKHLSGLGGRVSSKEVESHLSFPFWYFQNSYVLQVVPSRQRRNRWLKEPNRIPNSSLMYCIHDNILTSVMQVSHHFYPQLLSHGLQK